ncbi:MAG: NADH-quinone oxidoreductase subunit C [Bdellovibrionota bacterium]
MDASELISTVTTIRPGISQREKCNRPSVVIESVNLLDIMWSLQSREDLGFDMLLSHTAVDWIDEGWFELVYLLYSTKHGHYLMVSTFIPRESPVIATVSPIWKIAEWQEREVYDMFGVLYEDHPDLRRIFLDDDWEGFPLRKDYKDDFMLERPE